MRKERKKVLLRCLVGILSIIVLYEVVVILFCHGNVGIEISIPYGYNEKMSPDYSIYLDENLIFTRDKTIGKTSGCRKFFMLAPGRHQISIISSKKDIKETYVFSNLIFVQLIIECYDESPYIWIIKRHYPLRLSL